MLDREGTGAGGSWNRVAGADGSIRLLDNWDWNSYAVMSRDPTKRGGQYAYRSSVSHEGNFFHSKTGVLEVGSGFSNDIGYFRRTDTRKYLLDIGIRPRPPWLAPLGIREMHPHVVWNYYESLSGDVTAKHLHTGYTFFLSDGAFVEYSVNPTFQRIFTPFTINGAIPPIPPGGYAWTEHQLKGATDLSRPLSLQYTFTVGGLWSGRQRTQQLLVGVRPSAHFGATVGVSHTMATLDQPAATFDALLWTTRATYSFTTNMFLDGLAQYDPRAHLLNANMRFNLIHHPLSDLFVVLNQQRISTPDAPPVAPGSSAIVKYTHMFSF